MWSLLKTAILAISLMKRLIDYPFGDSFFFILTIAGMLYTEYNLISLCFMSV